MNARERLRGVFAVCIRQAREDPDPEIRLIAAANASLVASCILTGSDDACQDRVDILLIAAPELFPS